MSYTALYRKWRPSEFEDVKGQDHIVTTLKNQVKAERIGHAYLFCGTRGTGKTTIAKIFAKAVNCEHPVDGSPCGECAVCKAITAGSSMNVIEMDAASNNGVEDIRKIREEVQYSPTEGKYKVYIIDEVHMLSTGAFNALLKTLEEPPAYVIFILATTETHKIPITILSRCQRYDFKRITIDTIAARLSELMVEEKINVEDRAIRYVAKKADGSMRDALSLLDQCIAFYLGKDITYDNVLEVLGAVDTEVFSNILRAVLNQDIKTILHKIDELVMQGRDLGQFVNDFVLYLRNLLLLRTSENAEEIMDVSTENLKLLKEEGQMIDENTLMRYIRVFSNLSNEVKFSMQKRILIEVAFIKLAKPAMEESHEINDILSRITQLETRIEKGVFVTKDAAVPQNEPEEVVVEKKIEEALPQDLEEVARNWNGMIANLEDGPLISALNTSHPKVAEDKRGIDLVTTTEVSYMYINRPDKLAMITKCIENMTGKHVDIKVLKVGSNAEFKSRYNDIRDLIKTEIIVEDNEEDLI